MTMVPPIITFTSDFGATDWFTGVVHGVITGICPAARVIDLTHDVRPGYIERAAFIIEAAAPDFPQGTIHLAVVDPGVGTARRGLAVRAHGQYFVGPDNGVLAWAFDDPSFEARALIDTRWFRMPVSRSFHGRDVFAPVAAHLAAGVPLEQFGSRVTDPVCLPVPAPRGEDGVLRGRVMFIDRFGNALTNLREEAVREAFPGVPDDRLQVRALNRTLRGLVRTYGEAPRGALVALMGSSGRLEISVVEGDVAWRYGLGPGDPVTLREAMERAGGDDEDDGDAEETGRS
jgi:S-adenosylmethionine hydrolase